MFLIIILQYVVFIQEFVENCRKMLNYVLTFGHKSDKAAQIIKLFIYRRKTEETYIDFLCNARARDNGTSDKNQHFFVKKRAV